jgi:hypothetical protein
LLQEAIDSHQLNLKFCNSIGKPTVNSAAWFARPLILKRNTNFIGLTAHDPRWICPLLLRNIKLNGVRHCHQRRKFNFCARIEKVTDCAIDRCAAVVVIDNALKKGSGARCVGIFGLPSLFLGSSLIIYVSCKIISNYSVSDDASKG